MVDNDEIKELLESNDKWKKYYFSDVTILNYHQTLLCSGTQQCENNFKEIVLMNEQKIPSTGNSGLLGIRESTDLSFNLYKYARNVGAKKKKHTEPDLLELLAKHDISH